jgi:2-polyprenyl-3-methyl-5-hydroxy-6-metoxy-1,4-benzoquinol methylase
LEVLAGDRKGGLRVREQAAINKRAWEYRAYEFWNTRHGSPAEKAAAIKADPLARFHLHRRCFEDIAGKKIANPCGSNGRMAVPLAVLGAEVTVFDISEENRRYALELAHEAGVELEYTVGDFLETDTAKYGDAFDIVYAEGGILHYFSDIGAFTDMLYAITKPSGQLILSDFHPFRKVNPQGSQMMSAPVTGGDYFDSRLHEGAVAYQSFFPEDEQSGFPKCQVRLYTLSEIINAVIASGFTLKEFWEHPSYDDPKLPGLFTIIAYK